MSEIKLDSAFQRYPLDDYFDASDEYQITRWTDYRSIDTSLWNGSDSTLKVCDNLDLYNSLLRGDPIYFSGMYRMMTVSTGVRKRVYEKLLFLDPSHHRLHVFQDINKTPFPL